MVTFFGDSIMNGQYISPHKTFVHLISEALYPERVINASVNGRTSRQALEDMSSLGPTDTLIVQFGLNDCNEWDGFPRVSLDGFAANMKEISYRGCLQFGAKKVFFIVNHHCKKLGDAQYDYNKEIVRAAHETLAYVIDLTSISAKHLLDGIHLNEKGHKEYYKRIKKVLTK